MEKLRASEPPCRRLAAIGLVVAGLSLMATEGRAASPEALALMRGPGCGVPQGAPTAMRPGLVRAEPAARRRSRRTSPPAPPVAEEPAAALMQAFYTCAELPAAAVRVRGGWLVVGPVWRG